MENCLKKNIYIYPRRGWENNLFRLNFISGINLY